MHLISFFSKECFKSEETSSDIEPKQGASNVGDDVSYIFVHC